MNTLPHFRLEQAAFNIDSNDSTSIQFVSSDNTKKKGMETHITLLMGANGTCKSRILSSCVNFFREIEEAVAREEQHKPKALLYGPPQSECNLECLSAELLKNGHFVKLDNDSSIHSREFLPSRVLAIANLVRDRFVYEVLTKENSFYYYLGVRQASNMSTTGAMERLVSDAFLNIVTSFDKYRTFTNWVEKLFPECEIGLSFNRFSIKQNAEFFSDPEQWISNLFKKSRNNSRYQLSLEQLKEKDGYIKLRQMVDIIELFGEKLSYPDNKYVTRPAKHVLKFDKLLESKHEIDGGFLRVIYLMTSLKLIERPTFILKLKSGLWLDFMHLSSGEQNLIATGARLIAYATPASLIAIDEPEVSLNIAWQQRYIELISDALVHAPGSHVIIASHSSYLVADLRSDNSTVVIVEKRNSKLLFKSHPGMFWGWGSEAILYDVLGLPSASNYQFSRELAGVLKLIQNNSIDVGAIKTFLDKCDLLDFGADAEPLRIVVDEIRNYYEGIVR
jgi:predicted ATPase